MIKILMVDDDKDVLEINRKYFEENGCSVQICSHSQEAIDLAKKFKPDCILLDVMMPDMDGLEVCKQIRSFSNAPILFLSGKISENDKVAGFEAGADDYIEKPYSLKEVYLRIKVHIRRNSSVKRTMPKMYIDISPFLINLEEHKITYEDTEILLSNKEYDILLYLAQNAGSEITFEEIGKKIWGSYDEGNRRIVMVNVSRLRKKIEDQTGVDNLIETVWSKGYKLVKPKGIRYGR